MSAQLPAELAEKASRLRVLHEARAAAELAQADLGCPGSDVICSSGDLLADVLLLKGLPGPAEAAGGAALSGADGDAAVKALEALGWDGGSVFRALTAPVTGCEPVRRAVRVRGVVEAIDPQLVVALDAQAAADVARAFEIADLRPGAVVLVGGRRLLAVDEFEAALADPARKRAVWRQLKAATPPGPSY